MLWIINGWYYDENHEFHLIENEVMENAELIAFQGRLQYLEHYITTSIMQQYTVSTNTIMI